MFISKLVCKNNYFFQPNGYHRARKCSYGIKKDCQRCAGNLLYCHFSVNHHAESDARLAGHGDALNLEPCSAQECSISTEDGTSQDLVGIEGDSLEVCTPATVDRLGGKTL